VAYVGYISPGTKRFMKKETTLTWPCQHKVNVASHDHVLTMYFKNQYAFVRNISTKRCHTTLLNNSFTFVCAM